MKIILAVMVAALGVAAFSPAEARGRKSFAASEHERMMAFYADPSGTHLGHADWARAAFGSGEGANGL